jgi:hypothetical protein
MKLNVVIYSEELTREDLRRLLKSIRDCEQGILADKAIAVAIFAPEMPAEEVTAILQGLKPPFKQEPVVLAGISNKQ